MIVMVLLNVVQLKKISGRGFMNWLQIAIYCGSVVWYSFCLLGLPFNWFFLGTSLVYIIAFGLECGEFAAYRIRKENQGKLFAFLLVLLAFLPVLLSQAILANILPF